MLIYFKCSKFRSGLTDSLLSVFIFLILSVSWHGKVTAQGYFEYSETATRAYQLIFSLRFKEAREELVKLSINEPDNCIIYSLHNYLDCLGIFIGEQTDTYEKLRHHKQQRLGQIKERGDRGSPYFLYTQADIHLQWAITRVKFEDYFAAVMEIKRSYALLKKNQSLFPQFMPNKKNLGLLHALIGTVPDQYKWGPKLLGMTGTISQGKQEIEEVLAYAQQNDFVFKDEAYVMYAYLLLHLNNDEEEAWKLIKASDIDPTTNPLGCFIKANVAMKTGRNDVAIEVLSEKPKGPEYFPFPYLYFMEGVALLHKLDPNADKPLKLFLQQTKGLHYIKEAYQKLAWYELLQGRPHKFEAYMKACARLGSNVVEEDKTALYEARIGHMPDPILLTARMLFDGGYYDRAITYLEEIDPKVLIDKKSRLEYYYRLGRLKHAKGDWEEAIQHYQITIEQGEFEGFYFACNAALMMGRIYEVQHDYLKAQNAFEKTLQIKPDQYQSSLHQKAKAGLNRIAEFL